MPNEIPKDLTIPLKRTTLRQDVQDRVRSLLISGKLKAGSNLVERQLGAQLGVSRTPLREALLSLEAEGLLRVEPGRGFFVPEMSAKDAREIFSTIWTLESLAVERGRPRTLSGLEEANARFRGSTSADAALSADRAWHETLIRHCDCPRTAAILERLRALAARYEYRLLADDTAVANAADQHDGILRVLREGRYQAVGASLKENWQRGLDWAIRNG